MHSIIERMVLKALDACLVNYNMGLQSVIIKLGTTSKKQSQYERAWGKPVDMCHGENLLIYVIITLMVAV